jgi:cytochrome P450
VLQDDDLGDRHQAVPVRFRAKTGQLSRRRISRGAAVAVRRHAGPRICIGAAFAQQEATLALSAITREFDLAVAPGHVIWPQQRVTLAPRGGLPMIVTRRGRG